MKREKKNHTLDLRWNSRKKEKKNRKKREKELLVTEVDRGGSWEKREKLAWRARAALKVESSSDGMGSDDGGMPGKEKRNERERERLRE